MTVDKFMKLRLSGKLKTDIVELWVDSAFKTWRPNQVVIQDGKRLTELESMAFAGLSVFLHAEKYTDSVVANFERLKKHALYILVAIADFGDDLGFDWRKA